VNRVSGAVRARRSRCGRHRAARRERVVEISRRRTRCADPMRLEDDQDHQRRAAGSRQTKNPRQTPTPGPASARRQIKEPEDVTIWTPSYGRPVLMSIPYVQVRTTPLYSVELVATQDRVFCGKNSPLNEHNQWSWATGGLPTVVLCVFRRP